MQQAGSRSRFTLNPNLVPASAYPICRARAMMRLQRTERPVRTHQHVNGSILANQDRYVTGFQLDAVRGSRSFENSLGVSQEIRHEMLIAPNGAMFSFFGNSLFSK